MARSNKITDAIEIVHERYFRGIPEMLSMLEEARANDDIARKIYDLRTAARFPTQRPTGQAGWHDRLCHLPGSKMPTMKRHSLAMLNWIAAALNKRVKIDFVCPSPSDESRP